MSVSRYSNDDSKYAYRPQDKHTSFAATWTVPCQVTFADDLKRFTFRHIRAMKRPSSVVVHFDYVVRGCPRIFDKDLLAFPIATLSRF